MMFRRISAALRRKVLALSSSSAGVNPTVFVQWDSQLRAYQGIIELRSSVTGEKFQVAANQVEWKELFDALWLRFERDAKA